MPQVRKLTAAEVETLEYKPKGQRKLVEEQYDTILSEYDVGDYGQAELEPDENRLTIRNRLRAAALRRSLAIDFKRTTGNFIRFRIQEQNDTPAAAPAKRKGGRPKKET